MRTSGADGTVAAAGALRRRAMWRRVGVLIAVVVVVLQMQTPAPAKVGGTYQARVCAALQGVQAAFPGSDFIRQALAPFLARFACSPAGSTTTVLGPTTTFATVPPTTMPPGGTTVPPPSTTLPPCPTTSSTLFPTTVTTVPSCQG